MKKFVLSLLMALPMLAAAQTTVNFDTNPIDYKAVGVYDTWEASPFRKGTLKGNARVIPNHLKEATNGITNETDSIVGVQRSRFGSNTFGVRIDLKEPIATSEKAQYVHVLVYKDVQPTSKVMLIGLGRRETEAFKDEPTDVEQFWVESSYAMKANQWCDMVFPIKTVTGVKIYSFVIVPDLQSPHSYTSDFACYIDQIAVNSSSDPRGDQGVDYPVNFSKGQDNARAPGGSLASKGLRYVKGVSLTGADGQRQTYAPTTSDALYNKVYKDAADQITWDVTPGATYTPAVDYQGNWMHAYAYIDYDNDGQFSPVVNPTTRGAGEGSEAVSWSAYSSANEDPVYDSNGKSFTQGARATLVMPSFTIPDNTQPGFYRMRFKVDWNSIDPAGHSSIIENGGGIIDVLLNVHAQTVNLSGEWRNGTIMDSKHIELNDGRKIPFKQPLDIIVDPAGGFVSHSIDVRHGYNLMGKQYVHHNRQWQLVTYPAASFGEGGTFQIPADVIDGDVGITGNFSQKEYIVLDESQALSDEAKAASGTVVNVRLQRTLSTTAYNTMCLPFDLTASQVTEAFGDDARVYAYSNTSGSRIVFALSSEGVRANVPFLMSCTTTENDFRFDGVTLQTASPNPVVTGVAYDYVGNYDGLITLQEGLWFLSGNTFYRSTGKSRLRGYRAYFRAHEAARAPELVIDGETTRIATPGAEGGHADTYRLTGQKVSDEGVAQPQGVYVKGKKKVVVK